MDTFFSICQIIAHISHLSRYAPQVLGVFEVGINWNGIRHFAMLLVHLVLRQVFANTKEIEAEALKIFSFWKFIQHLGPPCF